MDAGIDRMSSKILETWRNRVLELVSDVKHIWENVRPVASSDM